MRFIDAPTLILIIIGGLDLGVLGLFEWDALGALLGEYVRLAYVVIGVSSVWQITRQKFQ